jgi:hypothetical protein
VSRDEPLQLFEPVLDDDVCGPSFVWGARNEGVDVGQPVLPGDEAGPAFARVRIIM